MDGIGLFEPATLALLHFGGARLFDKRRTARLVKVAERIMARPHSSSTSTLPQKLADRADLVGTYRLLECDRVTHERVLEPHRQRTLAAARAHPGVVLLIHDTTELDFTDQPALADQLGQIGKGTGRGWLCHNTLAVALSGGSGSPAAGAAAHQERRSHQSQPSQPAALAFDVGGPPPPVHRQVLGLASQVLHKRRAVPEGETPAQKRAHPGRESRLWLQGCELTGTPPQSLTSSSSSSSGDVTAGVRWVDVADRGSDTIEFIEYEVTHGRSFVIRLAKDRNLDGDHAGAVAGRLHRKLMAYVQDQPVLGTRQVRVPATTGKHAAPARVATVSVSAAPLRLRASRFARGECRGVPLDLWVVLLRETTTPPPGVPALQWVLLTNVPAPTFAAASERIDWYEHRPVIEDYHKGQKSGVGIERSRFRETDRLEPMVALLSVVAAVLLGLRDIARRPDAEQRPATDLVPAVYAKVLAAQSARRAKEKGPRARPPATPDMSVRTFLVEVARLGGFQARNSDGHPGWQTLWRGWTSLQLMVDAVLAMSG